MTITHSPEGREHRPYFGPYLILEPLSGGDLMVLHEDRQWIALFESPSQDRCEQFIRQQLADDALGDWRKHVLKD